MEILNDENIDTWVKHRVNVLLRGRHGVGKTHAVLAGFDRAKLKYLYFSAATMDPWVDFIGVPKEQRDADGKVYLDLVRPKHFVDDQVEAIFLDEYNRAPQKVRNAVMELIQFKSINGKKFPNLKMVWAAINPENEEGVKYDVEELDPAQVDRFHVIVEIPYKLNNEYLENKFGDAGRAGISWWNSLTEEEKYKVSPRRLEYAIDLYVKGINVHHVLPQGISVSKFIQEMKNGSTEEVLARLYKTKDLVETKKRFTKANFVETAIPMVVKKKEYIDFFVPVLKDEHVVRLVESETAVAEHVFKDDNVEKYLSVIKSMADAQGSKRSAKAKQVLKGYNARDLRNKAWTPKTSGTMSPANFETEADAVIREDAPLWPTWAKGLGRLMTNMPTNVSDAGLTKCLDFLEKVFEHSVGYNNFNEVEAPEIYGFTKWVVNEMSARKMKFKLSDSATKIYTVAERDCK